MKVSTHTLSSCYTGHWTVDGQVVNEMKSVTPQNSPSEADT